MNVELDNTRRAYEAAKRIAMQTSALAPRGVDAIFLFDVTKAIYEAAMLADAQAKLDAMGVVIGETLVECGSGFICKIDRIRADATKALVWAEVSDSPFELVNAALIRPYVAPVVKEMVLYRKVDGKFTNWSWIHDDMRLTLSGITPADLDGMTGPITGTYIVEKL